MIRERCKVQQKNKDFNSQQPIRANPGEGDHQRLNVEKRECNFFSTSVLKLLSLGWDVFKPNFGVLKFRCTRTQRHDPQF
jgi:hypothetical protein